MQKESNMERILRRPPNKPRGQRIMSEDIFEKSIRQKRATEEELLRKELSHGWKVFLKFRGVDYI